MKQKLILSFLSMLLSLWSFYMALLQENPAYILLYMIMALGCVVVGKILLKKIEEED